MSNHRNYITILAFSIMHDTLHYVAPFKPRISKYLANEICSHSTCEVGVFPAILEMSVFEAQ